MTHFRPCIDLHRGRVKQIVGGTLDAHGAVENHVSPHDAAWFAGRYADDGLTGGHVICLGPGNDMAARSALAAYSGGMQIGGGVNVDNAAGWLDAGASHVIVTSWLFDGPTFRTDRLKTLVGAIGRHRIVIDLSCRRHRPVELHDDGDRSNRSNQTAAADEVSPRWYVASNRWSTRTDLTVDLETLSRLSDHCDEFLIHAADVEGRCGGVDEALVRMLGAFDAVPLTYAGGIASQNDIDLIAEASGGVMDYTVGSALDLFGGDGVQYERLVAANRTGPDKMPR